TSASGRGRAGDRSRVRRSDVRVRDRRGPARGARPTRAGSAPEAVTSSDLLQALTPVIEALEALDVRYYVGGSVASSNHGVPRASVDADVVADLHAEHVDRFVAALGAAYYVPEGLIRDAVGRRRSFNLIHLVSMFKIDVFVSKGRAFDREALSRAGLETLAE